MVLRSLCKTADLTCIVYSECIPYCYINYSLSTYLRFKSDSVKLEGKSIGAVCETVYS